MRRALPAAGTFVLTLLFLDPIRLPELAAGLAAAAGSAGLVLLLAVVLSRRHCRESLPPAAGPPPAAGRRHCRELPLTQPMRFEYPPGVPVWGAVEYDPCPEGSPGEEDAVHRNVAREWDGTMRHSDEVPGTADMTEFEEKWKLP